MKHLRKVLTLVLAAFMALAVATPAFAASITLNNTAEDQESNTTQYTYYEVLKADLSALEESDYNEDGSPKEGTKVVYYVTKEALATALQATGKFNVHAAGTNRWNVELKDETTTAADLVTALNVEAVKNAAEASGTFAQNGGESATSGELDPGYYLVLSSNGTNVVLQTLADVIIDEKNTYPGVDKSITGENGADLAEAVTEDNLHIGDTVTYTVPVEIPANVAEKQIVVTDTMHKGLTLNTDSFAAANDDGTITSTGWLSSPQTSGDNKVYTITIPAATVLANAGKTITLTYTATLNADAVINGDTPNTVKLTYDNYTTKDHTVVTKTYKVEINKVDQDGAKLAGVKFTLQRSDNKYYQTKNGDNSVWTDTKTEFTTDDTNNIVFEGIDAGTYTLTETYTPDGYNPLEGPVTVVVAEDGKVTYTSTDSHNTANGAAATDGVITIKNQSGSVLPSTGGMGTTILYTLGGILVVGGAIFLIAKNRSAKMGA